jgi:hypothetical protein
MGFLLGFNCTRTTGNNRKGSALAQEGERDPIILRNRVAKSFNAVAKSFNA